MAEQRELRFAVIGSPIMHSRSPNMHAAAYAALGLPHVYEKIETHADELEARVAALRDGTFAGLNVTVPHKTNVLAFVDEIDESAGATGAANTLVRMPRGGVRAHNTDAPALGLEILRLANGNADAFKNMSAVVLGTGGAARAALFALASLGISHIAVRGRKAKAKPELADIAAPASVDLQSLTRPEKGERDDLRVIIQATTAGMDGSNTPGDVVADAVAWDSVHPACVVYDVVYAPPKTALIIRAKEEHHLSCDNGLGMLARQGALAFELWLGIKAPLDVMRAAL